MRRLRKTLRPVRRFARRVRARALRAWLATGDAVECPCCGSSFREFLPTGAFRRPNVRCPACGSHERHRMLWLFIRDRTDLLEAPARFLHFAPEPSLRGHLEGASPLEYETADLDSPDVTHQVDITALPFPDASFDRILCSHVLEHVDDDRRAMRELRRVLRPDGWAIVMVPLHGGLEETLEDPEVTTDEQRLRIYGQADHLRLYGRDFAGRLRESGFEVEVHRHARELGEEAVRRFVLLDEEIFMCRH